MSKKRNDILLGLAKSKTRAVGNSKRTLLNVAQDLLLQEGRQNSRRIAQDCFMATATIERVMDADCNINYEGYQPRAHTIEKIFRHCNVRVDVSGEVISGKYQNQPKKEE